jgi:hypothetical protein
MIPNNNKKKVHYSNHIEKNKNGGIQFVIQI